MKLYRVVVHDPRRHTFNVRDPALTFDQVKMLPWRQAMNWGDKDLRVEIDVSEETGMGGQSPWNFLRRVGTAPPGATSVFIPDWEASGSSVAPAAVYDATTDTTVVNAWPDMAPAPGWDNALVRVVVEEEGKGGGRYCFTNFTKDVTLTEVEVHILNSLRPGLHLPKVTAPGTQVSVDVRETPTSVWASYRMLKTSEVEPIRMFDEVMASRAYTYDGTRPAPGRNPVPMKPDPVLMGVIDDDLKRLILGRSVTDAASAPPPGMYHPDSACGRLSAATALRATAARKRAEAGELDALAKIADTLTPDGPEEHALWDLINKRS